MFVVVIVVVAAGRLNGPLKSDDGDRNEDSKIFLLKAKLAYVLTN